MSAKKTSHPYIPSAGILTQVFEQFRRAMPKVVDAATLKKLGIAPNNESHTLRLLRFLGIIDDNGNQAEGGKKLFLIHDNEKFQVALATMTQEAYKELFELRGTDAWKLDRDNLIGFFRATDETSQLTATRQSVAFETLAALSGKSDREVKSSSGITRKTKKKPATKPATKQVRKVVPDGTSEGSDQGGGDVALTVRIEVNLPANGSQETYDAIFQSIRKNLIDG